MAPEEHGAEKSEAGCSDTRGRPVDASGPQCTSVFISPMGHLSGAPFYDMFNCILGPGCQGIAELSHWQREKAEGR